SSTRDWSSDVCYSDLRAVGLAVRLPGLDHAHVEPGNAAQPFQHRAARLLGLPRALAEILARAFVDHDDRDGAQRVAVLAGERRRSEERRGGKRVGTDD